MNIELIKEVFLTLVGKSKKADIKSMTSEERKAYRAHQKLIRGYVVKIQFTGIALVVTIIAVGIAGAVIKSHRVTKEPVVTEIPFADEEEVIEPPEPEEPPAPKYFAIETDSTKEITSEVISEYAIVINSDTDEILATKNAYERMYPASMTKVLTILTAAEHMDKEALEDSVTLSSEAVDFAYANDCSTAGFELGETVKVKDLYYGTILPSGGDAAAQLGIYVAGSTDAFVDMMNDELAVLGLSETSHVTNMIGIHDSEHYMTVFDMAIILEAAMDNEICREVLTAHTYNTTPTEQHPEGDIMSNWFLRRIEDRSFGGTIQGAKTGYTVKAGSCAASCELTNGGSHLICVTGHSSSSWNAIADHVALYKLFAETAE